MSHYAKVLDGKVINVIVAEQDFFNTFVDSSPGQWIQTSYNTRGGIHYAPNSNTPDNGVALRGNYAGIGYIYDAKNDVFYQPQPYPSWTLNKDIWTWEAPTPMPTTGGPYDWDETTKTWLTITI
jgi:hypothetical protein